MIPLSILLSSALKILSPTHPPKTFPARLSYQPPLLTHRRRPLRPSHPPLPCLSTRLSSLLSPYCFRRWSSALRIFSCSLYPCYHRLLESNRTNIYRIGLMLWAAGLYSSLEQYGGPSEKEGERNYTSLTTLLPRQSMQDRHVAKSE